MPEAVFAVMLTFRGEGGIMNIMYNLPEGVYPMFEIVFESIMSMLFGLGFFALGIWLSRNQRQIGNYIQCYGTVTDVDDIQKTVAISYKLGGKTYSSTLNEELRANVDSLPPKGISVSVTVYADDPTNVFYVSYPKQMGRGLGRNRNYVNLKKSAKYGILLGILGLVYGLYKLFSGLGILT